MPKNIKHTCLVFLMALMLSACSTTALKEENASLKATIDQDQQALRDYADKLKAANEMSAQEREKAESEMAALQRELDKALQDLQVAVQRLEDLAIIELPYNMLFESAQADMSGSGKDVVTQLADAFKKYPGYHMRIEGHTDSMPIGASLKQRYHSNWELSAGRAATVAKYLIYALNVPAENVSIAGYADKRPVADNATKEGRAKNRRIRVVVFKQ